MIDPTTEWSDTDELILGGLAAGLTHAEAGELASVSAKTVQRRLRDDAFAAEVGRRRSEQVERITGRLTELSVRAVATLERGLDDLSVYPRLRAADLTLNWLVKLRREADLERRIAEIERTLSGDTAEVTS